MTSRNATLRTCAWPECGREFEAARASAKYCSTTCRSRAARDRKAAAAAEKSDRETESGKAEHELVRAVRQELTRVHALTSVNGQIALQLARRVVEADAKGVSALTKELRTVLAEATAGAVAGAAPVPEPDGLDEIGRRRAEKKQRARQTKP